METTSYSSSLRLNRTDALNRQTNSRLSNKKDAVPTKAFEDILAPKVTQRATALAASSSTSPRANSGAAFLKSTANITAGRNLAQSPFSATAAAPPLDPLKQNWLNANPGPYANLMLHNLGRSAPFNLEGVNVQWANFSTGKNDSSPRAVGNVDKQGGQELASLLGGTLVDSPFGTFGTQQKDQYIRMPNGQMIDASILANNLNAARASKDPFSATQSILDVYKIEAANFDLSRSTDALDGVTKGFIRAGLPT